MAKEGRASSQCALSRWKQLFNTIDPSGDQQSTAEKLIVSWGQDLSAQGWLTPLGADTPDASGLRSEARCDQPRCWGQCAARIRIHRCRRSDKESGGSPAAGAHCSNRKTRFVARIFVV